VSKKSIRRRKKIKANKDSYLARRNLINDDDLEDIDEIIDEFTDKDLKQLKDNTSGNNTFPDEPILVKNRNVALVTRMKDNSIKINVFDVEFIDITEVYAIEGNKYVDPLITPDGASLISTFSIGHHKVKMTATHAIIGSGLESDFYNCNPAVMIDKTLPKRNKFSSVNVGDKYNLFTYDIMVKASCIIAGKVAFVCYHNPFSYKIGHMVPSAILISVSEIDRYILSGSVIRVKNELFVVISSIESKINKGFHIIMGVNVIKHDTDIILDSIQNHGTENSF
jgi:hypothetical protein